MANLVKGNVSLPESKPVGVKVTDFDGGVNTLFSQTRLKKNEAAELTNMWLIEDGVPDKRPGTAHYGGVTFTNRPDGAWEYRTTAGARELIVVADGKVWRVDPDASTKTEITGATFTSGYACDAIQISNKLYIVNGQDSMATYDGSTLSSYTEIAAPAWGGTPLARGAGLSAGAITLYYRVTASNNVGETTPNAEQSITVNMGRDSWSAATEYIDVDWAAVVGATKYTVYISDASGFEVKLAETTDTTFRDDGTYSENPYIEPPTNNTTGGPKFAQIALCDNRIVGTKDPNNPWTVYYSGTGINLGIFASGYGGGWIKLEYGGRATCQAPLDFQSLIHIFCKTDDGRGTIWQMPFEGVVVGSELINVPQPEKIISAIGCGDPRTICYVENDVMFWNSANGLNALGNEPGILDVLRTNEITSKIRNYARALPNTGDKCAYYWNSKLLISYRTSESSGSNFTGTIVFDRERNCVIKPWTIGVSQFLEFTDSAGVTHLLGIASDRLIKFSENYQSDSGTAFAWDYLGPRFPMGDDFEQFARRFRAAVKLRSVSGEVEVTVLGTGKSGSFESIATATVEGNLSQAGMGWDLMGNFLLGDTDGLVVTFDSDSLIRYLWSNGLLREIQLKVSGSNAADRAVLLGYKFQGTEDDTEVPLDWKL